MGSRPSNRGASRTRSCQPVTWLNQRDRFGKQWQLGRFRLTLRLRNSAHDTVSGPSSLELERAGCDRIEYWLIVHLYDFHVTKRIIVFFSQIRCLAQFEEAHSTALHRKAAADELAGLHRGHSPMGNR